MILSFNFDLSDLKNFGITPERWQQFVRETEFFFIAKAINLHVKNGLELGAGDGGQSVEICKYCEYLVCTELSEYGNRLGVFRERKLNNVVYRFMDATNLSEFKDGQFDFVFSSNMLEHIKNWPKALSESSRVLSSEGIMVHVMPSRCWKLWNFLISILWKREVPQIHGIELDHLREFIAFGESEWEKKIYKSGLVLENKIRMPFYFGHGPSPLWLIMLGNWLGWSASTAYVIKRYKHS